MAWILGVNRSHDGGITLLKDNKVVLSIQEERLTHIKYDNECFYSLDKVAEYTKVIDVCVYTHLYNRRNDFGPYFKYIKRKLGLHVKNYLEAKDYHHSLHAACAYFHSPFDDATVLVIDGAGADHEYGKENESIIHIPGSAANAECLYQSVVGYVGSKLKADAPSYVDPEPRIGAGYVYSGITKYLGWDGLECGKTMGLSSYGKPNPKIKSILDEGGGRYQEFGLADFNNHKEVMVVVRPYEYICSARDEKEKFQRDADLAYKLQSEFEDYVYMRIMQAYQLSNCPNIIFTGGCALNCVANYRIRKRLPPEINLYVEPISSDSGVSLGAAYIGYNKEMPMRFAKKPLMPIDNIYFGQQLQYEEKYENERPATPSDVAKLIADGNIVAMAQGRSENGPRALGNRSILYDPRDPNGKDKVNTVKKRENWRPFAGTVMLEYAHEWFDMAGLPESPYMMYAMEVLRPDEIPCITHVDNTCRIQTLTEKQNPNYYKLISEFNNLTGVPILFNTSFNLAGDTIVETMEDAFNTMNESLIEYLYLPEENKLLYFPNETN